MRIPQIEIPLYRHSKKYLKFPKEDNPISLVTKIINILQIPLASVEKVDQIDQQNRTPFPNFWSTLFLVVTTPDDRVIAVIRHSLDYRLFGIFAARQFLPRNQYPLFRIRVQFAQCAGVAAIVVRGLLISALSWRVSRTNSLGLLGHERPRSFTFSLNDREQRGRKL